MGRVNREFLTENLIAGVYTNKDKYFKQFTDNWQEYYSNVELIYNVDEGKINENMEKLRHKFMNSDKRYWLFMDDDILFTRNDVIETCLYYMQKNDLDLITTYQSTDLDLVKKANPENLTFEYICWGAGYFMLIDSKKCGLIPFDLNLPTTHGSLSDIAYCMDIIEKEDALIGIAPTLIYHKGDYSPQVEKLKITKENEKQINENVSVFLKNLDPKLLYNDPKIEIVLLGNGEIDYNETIGHHYLKHKHPDIYYEIVARLHYDRVKKNTNAVDGFSHHYFGEK